MEEQEREAEEQQREAEEQAAEEQEREVGVSEQTVSDRFLQSRHKVLFLAMPLHMRCYDHYSYCQTHCWMLPPGPDETRERRNGTTKRRRNGETCTFSARKKLPDVPTNPPRLLPVSCPVGTSGGLG